MRGVGQLIMRIAPPLRWHAASRGVQAVRDYDNARKTAGGNSSPESDAAWQRVLYAASILLRIRKTRALALLRFDDSPRAR